MANILTVKSSKANGDNQSKEVILTDNDGELLETAEQVFMPLFAKRRIQAKRRAFAQRRKFISRRKYTPKKKPSYSWQQQQYYYRPTRRYYYSNYPNYGYNYY